MITWKEDYPIRVGSPERLTGWLHDAVPILKFINFKVLEVDEGYTRTLLPLNYESTNQHLTHQASLFVTLADYTGGIALATYFYGCPVLGVHPGYSENGAALWLLTVDIEYNIPSTEDLIVSCRVPPERIEKIKGKFFRGQSVIEKLTVEFRNRETLIAEAQCTYFAQQLSSINQGSTASKTNILTDNRRRTSSRLSSGLALIHDRALGSGEGVSSLSKSHQLGLSLASRIVDKWPEVGKMFSAKRDFFQQSLSRFTSQNYRQIVFIRPGLDLYHDMIQTDGIRVFEIDRPVVLAERDEIMKDVKNNRWERYTLELNDLLLKADKILSSHSMYDSLRPTLFIFNTTFWDIEEHKLNDILLSIRRLMVKSDNSVLLMDVFVKPSSDSVQEEDEKLILKFLEETKASGYQFFFDFKGGIESFQEKGFKIIEKTRAAALSHRDSSSAIINAYHFVHLGPQEDLRTLGPNLESSFV